MPQAWPIFWHRYVQFLPPDPKAPPVERGAWTQEVKGRHRYGTGVLYRLPGPVPVGVLLGKWTERPLDLRQQIAAERSRRDHGLRVIRPDEEDAVFEGVVDGQWHPPLWHWRAYVGLAWRLDLVYADGFGNLHWKRPRWTIRNIASTPLTDAFDAGDVEGIDAALPKRTVAPDPGWEDEVRNLAIQIKRQRDEAEAEASQQIPTDPHALQNFVIDIRRAMKERDATRLAGIEAMDPEAYRLAQEAIRRGGGDAS